MKQKKCKQCKEAFTPFRPLQQVCSAICGVRLTQSKIESKQRKEIIEKKKEIACVGSLNLETYKKIKYVHNSNNFNRTI